MHSAGQQQLLTLAYPEPTADTNPITPKNNTYYTTSDGIQILTWNIHHGLDCIMRPRLLEIAKYLSVAHSHADIICLQEVNTSFMFIPGHGLINQATYLAAYLGYHCYYHNNLAILSKAPIIQEMEPIQTKHHANKFTGNIIGCTININNQAIKIYNCHLPNDISGVSQLYGITNKHNGLLARVLDDTYNNLPVIITGDFNCNELFGAIQTLKKITTVASTSHASYPVIVPLIQLDYILTNGEWVGWLKIQSSAADYNCHLSDHYPIEALVSLGTLPD
jgi:endonuclease/exonuclease/phosphatase family metal-dependent hydrolase